MALFPLPVKAEMSDRFKMPVSVLQFGDGYEQTGLAGLNRPQTTWDIEVIISSAAQDALFNSFLAVHGQHKSFTWRSPRDTAPQFYRITGDVSSTRRNGGGSKPVFFSRRMQFKSTSIESIIGLASPALLLLKFASSPAVDTGKNSVEVFNSASVTINAGEITFNSGYLQIARSAINISLLATYTIEVLYTPTVITAIQILATTYRYPAQAGHMIISQINTGGEAEFASYNPVINRLTHLAITRSNGVFKTWLNGALVDTTTRANFNQDGDLYIGASPGDTNLGGAYFTGTMSGLKISDSVIYTSNFNPPLQF